MLWHNTIIQNCDVQLLLSSPLTKTIKPHLCLLVYKPHFFIQPSTIKMMNRIGIVSHLHLAWHIIIRVEIIISIDIHTHDCLILSIQNITVIQSNPGINISAREGIRCSVFSDKFPLLPCIQKSFQWWMSTYGTAAPAKIDHLPFFHTGKSLLI